MAAHTFTALYNKLNAEQKQAVDTIEGPVIVIAGPGTGKTQILTLRIANILRKTDTPPEAILALTFTESAAATCRRRLVDIVGANGYRVQIHTFHGYANEIIQRFPDSFPRIVGSRALTNIERISLLQELIDVTPLTILRPFGNIYFYVPALSQKISELKRENISPFSYDKILKKRLNLFESIPDLYDKAHGQKNAIRGKYAQTARRLARDRELLRLYRAYENALAKRHVYDYEDMLLEVIHALEKNRELLLTLQEECQYVLADEHQDANESQNRLLELLISFHASPNVFVVGDEKQAIFRFQGASMENFLFFKKRYPKATIITLRKNYRSTQSILDSAHALISQAQLYKKFPALPLIARHQDFAEKIQVISLPRLADELTYVVKEIKHNIAKGVRPRDIAVLYRVNRDAQGIVEALTAEAIPSVVDSEQNILADLWIRKFLAILAAIAGYGHDDLLVPSLYLDFIGLPPLSVAIFLARVKHNLFEALTNRKMLEKIGIKRPVPFLLFAKKLERWKILAHNSTLMETLDAVAEESGLLAAILQAPYPEERLATLGALYTEARAVCMVNRHASLQAFLDHLALLEEYHLPISASSNFKERQAVRLMTAHRAKGLEFEYVYIIHARDKHWGNRSERAYFSPLSETKSSNDIEDERRLFYVALTRAKRKVTITYSRESESGASALPSQYIEEIGNKFLFRQELEDMHFPVRHSQSSVGKWLDQTLLKSLFTEQGLSATAINNYLECPWRYFYRNLLRIPEAPEKALEYGTAVHTALREFFELWKEGDNPGARGLVVRFKRALQKSSLSDTAYREALSKGTRALTAYYKQWHTDWSRSIINEYKLTALLPIDLTGLSYLRLRGDVDKVSFNDNGVIIHDYKTGKRKTHGKIIGKSDASGWNNYKRQLVFYKLLFDLRSTSQRIRGALQEVNTGVIEFLEPDERGRCIREQIPLTTEESIQLQTLVRSIATEIWYLRFVSKGCSKKECRYCALKEFMGPSLAHTNKLSR